MAENSLGDPDMDAVLSNTQATATTTPSSVGDPDMDAVLQHAQTQHAAAHYNPSEGGGTLNIGPIDTHIKTPEWLDRTLAGAGKSMVDMGRGAGQLLGLESKKDVEDARELDKPLDATTAGKVGEIVGGVATAAPAMLIPGANTALGAGAIGTAYGALQPSTSDNEAIANLGLGAASGIGGHLVGSALSGGASKLMQATKPSLSDQALGEAQKLGYVVPPSTTNPSIANRVLEGFAGKVSTAQGASIKNQAITNNLVRQELGLHGDAPLTHDTMDAVRQSVSPAYEAVKSVPDIKFGPEYAKELDALTKTSNKITSALPNYKTTGAEQVKQLIDSIKPENGVMDGETAVELSKSLRAEAAAHESSAVRTGDPQARLLARAYRGSAEAVENAVEKHLTDIGKPELASDWDNARRTIAKSYSVQNALDGAGNVDAGKLGKQLLKGKPLSGNLEAAANFANAFPKAAKVVKESMPGMSPLDVYGSAALEAATGNPYGLLVGPGRMAARAALLSPKIGQKMAMPSNNPGVSATGLSLLSRGAGKLAKPLAIGNIPDEVSTAQDLMATK